MLQLIYFALFIMDSTMAGSSNNIQIEGAGLVNADRTSMDLHLEVTKLNVANPSTPPNLASTQPTSLPPTAQTTVPGTPLYSASDTRRAQDKLVFGIETVDQFLKSVLESHNKFRAIHNSPPLRLNRQMSKEAENFAKKLAQEGAKHQPMMHEDGMVLKAKNEGENLAAGGGSLGGLTGKGAVKNWYDEVCSYNWGKGGYEQQAAHFMQLVWKGSTELGIGKALGMKNGLPYTYIVARYKPAITYDAKNNVHKGSFNSTYCKNVRALLRQSGILLKKPTARAGAKQFGRFGKRLKYFKKQARVQTSPVFPTGNARYSTNNYNYQIQPAGIPSIPQKNDGSNALGTLGNANQEYGEPRPLAYFTSNPWAATNNNEDPTAASEYYPKQAEVLEEFVEGDDPDQRKFRDSTSSSSESLIPVMNSEDAEVADEPTEDDVRRKTQVPKH